MCQPCKHHETDRAEAFGSLKRRTAVRRLESSMLGGCSHRVTAVANLSFHTSPNLCRSAFAKHSMIDSVTHVVPLMATFLSISEDTLSDFSISIIWTLAISLGFSTTGSGSFESSGTNPRDLDPSTVSQAAHTLRTRTTILKLHPSSSSTPLLGARTQSG